MPNFARNLSVYAHLLRNKVFLCSVLKALSTLIHRLLFEMGNNVPSGKIKEGQLTGIPLNYFCVSSNSLASSHEAKC